MIKITLDDTQAVKKLQSVAARLKEPRRLYALLGEELKKIHDERFKAEKDPNGKPWKPLTAKTLERKRKHGKSLKILRQDGNLANKTAYNILDDGVEFGSPEVYAALHQFGGKAGKGRQVTIPARPWLGVSKENEYSLLKKAAAHLQKTLGKIK